MIAIWPIKSREVTVTGIVAVSLHTASSMETGEPGVGAVARAVGEGALGGISTALQVQSHSVQTHGPQATHKRAPLKLCRSWSGMNGEVGRCGSKVEHPKSAPKMTAEPETGLNTEWEGRQGD